MSQPVDPIDEGGKLLVGVRVDDHFEADRLEVGLDLGDLACFQAPLTESLTAMCSGGTDLPSSNFFAASGSPPGFSPRFGAT